MWELRDCCRKPCPEWGSSGGTIALCWETHVSEWGGEASCGCGEATGALQSRPWACLDLPQP